MRLPVLVSCACFVVSFGLGYLAFIPVRPAESHVSSSGALSDKNADTLPQPSISEDGSTPDARREGLVNAFDHANPLSSAAKAVAWVDAATIEDFRALAESPEKVLWPRLSKMNKDFRIAFYEAIAARWLDLDPTGGFDGLRKIQKTEPLIFYTDAQEILSAAARVRPEIVLASAPLESGTPYLEACIGVAFETLAGRDPKAARQLLDRFKSPELLKAAEIQIAQGIIKIDPLSAVSLVQQLDNPGLFNTALEAAERIGPGIVRQLVSAAGGKLDDHPYLPRLLLKDPDLASSIEGSLNTKDINYYLKEHLQLADQLSQVEQQRLLNSYDKLQPGSRDALTAAVACSWARTEPTKAAEWALAHAQPNDRTSSANRAADLVFLRWVNNAPDAALAWWQSLPPSPLRDALGSNASTYIAENGQLDLALSMCRPQGDEADASIAAHMAQFISQRDPAEAADWIKSLPAETDTKNAAKIVISEWITRDAGAAAKWVESLPAGPRRDGALIAFVEEAAEQNVESAAEWVATIADPKLKLRAASEIFGRLRNSDPPAAAAWLRGLKGIDPKWHARLLRKYE